MTSSLKLAILQGYVASGIQEFSHDLFPPNATLLQGLSTSELKRDFLTEVLTYSAEHKGPFLGALTLSRLAFSSPRRHKV
jgi:hypothetical protein